MSSMGALPKDLGATVDPQVLSGQGLDPRQQPASLRLIATLTTYAETSGPCVLAGVATVRLRATGTGPMGIGAMILGHSGIGIPL